MPSLIAFIYILCFASLALWLLFKEQKEISKIFGTLFGISFLVYLLNYLVFPGPMGYFRLVIGLVMLFAGGFVLNIFSNNKILFVLLLGAAILGLWNMPEIPKIPFLNTKVTNLEGIDPNFELLVELKPGKKAKDLDKIIEKYDLKYETAFEVGSPDETDLDDYIVIDIPDNRLGEYDKIIAELEKSGMIDGLEQNEIVSLFKPIKNEKKQTKKISKVLNDPDLDKQWSADMMQLDTLHRYLSLKKIKPKKTAKIAIIDTGVDAGHEDLIGNYISTRIEYDEDPQGHGTHCAGIAAAVTNNRKGIASFSPGKNFIQVTSIQVFPRRGGTTQRNIIRGMILAVDSGADVLSMSLGGPSSDAAQRAYKEAVAYANSKGAIVVVAAGNEDSDARDKVPASVEGVITVAAVDADNRKAKFSNDISKIKWGIAAPGVNIYSSMPDSRYDYMSGTSMATPYVAGLLGLMKSLDPTLDTKRAFAILNNSGIATHSGNSTAKLIQPMSAISSLLK